MAPQPDYLIHPGDIVIAIMGVTGAGKSTFIQHFTDEELMIGHGLESKTSEVEIFPCTLPSGTKVHLVDTPGFDDTYRSDTEILRELASWLSEACQARILLTGIIYLHRIGDIRLGGSGMKNLRMFKKLCGDESLGSVAAQRETQLKTRPDFWKHMIDNGSAVFRQDEGKKSAFKIVEYLIEKKRPRKLNIQNERVEQGLPLDQTEAGQEVQNDILKQRRQFEKQIEQLREDMEEAVKEKDRELEAELGQYRAEIEEKMRRANEDVKRMQASKEELHRQMDSERRRFMEQERKKELKAMQAVQKDRSSLVIGLGLSQMILGRIESELAQTRVQRRLAGDEGAIDELQPVLTVQKVRDISESLRHSGHESWSKIPRIYAMLQKNWSCSVDPGVHRRRNYRHFVPFHRPDLTIEVSDPSRAK